MANRKALVAGNWKMNGLMEFGKSLSVDVAARYKKAENPNCEVLVCPPFTFICEAIKAVVGSNVMIGGQDCHQNESGAHTGDISAAMLKDIGCSHVIVGHSERRTNHKETDELVCEKTKAAIKAGLVSIICIGETESERDAGKTLEVCKTQFKGSVPKEATPENIVIAYEPVWAIGTGKTPTTNDVAEVHAAIRKLASETMGVDNAARLRILYGGSVKPSNAKELMSLEDVDGALVGGASLKAEDFWAIVEAKL